MDGVLLDAKIIHFDSLNIALSEVGEQYVITEAEHLSIYDGLKTNQKLEMLTISKNLPVSSYKQIWDKKQSITIDKLMEIKEDRALIDVFENIKKRGIKIACCSNSIRKTIYVALSRLGIIHYFDLIISNEDVVNAKPNPEMYWKAMTTFSTLPEDTLIIEDSPNGLLAAHRSNANVLRVKNSSDLTIDKINDKINKIKHMNTNKWQDEKLNVLIPMAGAGSRFEKAGYVFPKPLIEVRGKPMIQVVVENLNIEANYIYIVQKSHREKYNLDVLLNLITPNCKIIEVDGITEGAACTTLLAKQFIDNENPLLMANSDQFVEWDSSDFMYKMQEQDVDAGILTFESTHPKWSYAKLDDHGFVTEVAEKNPISNIATVGIYYWKNGKDYVKYAEQMISKNLRFNNEFYVCPVFNEAIEDSKKIKVKNVENMWGLGTPEDLNYFLGNHK